MKFFAQIVILLAALQCWPGRLCAQEAPARESVKDARNALNGRTPFPFYDSAKDDVKRMNVKAPPDAAPPAKGSTTWTRNGTTPVRGGGGRGGASGLGALLQIIGVALFTAVISAVVYFLVKAFLQGEQTQTEGTKFIDTSSDVDRVEDLPFQIKKPTGDFLSEAQRLYEAGQYSEAIVYLFSYQLVALDKRHVIRLAKGKTNRQYLRETRSREMIKQVLQRTMISFEDVFFGHHNLSRERFEECWRQLDEFHQQLERVEAAAA
ncbi:DUF4129 domain-containing protein [Anatilimnocola floriformis]|uniref:DUF4129 domain-containing protein n=1 Tax=Anatilimnocola floriformis TaxID=2948575 RepID=UPI0020C4F7D0|nr:DUF4129 domain-containing protein [Anatilimnocola floriformis]